MTKPFIYIQQYNFSNSTTIIPIQPNNQNHNLQYSEYVLKCKNIQNKDTIFISSSKRLHYIYETITKEFLDKIMVHKRDSLVFVFLGVQWVLRVLLVLGYYAQVEVG